MKEDQNMQFISEEHDHQHCIVTALADAEQLCLQRKQRFTALRKRVFELVWQQHKPIRAYEVLSRLQQDGRAAPPTVYRALDFLLELGLIHRIESLNAYVGCSTPGQKHTEQFLICTRCDAFTELNSALINKAINESATQSGFKIKQQMIEITGICPNCQTEESN
tara:strand:+ start:16208 stop:16702 length:495 start_codon:yes stop_codon:yes gene_type:complete